MERTKDILKDKINKNKIGLIMIILLGTFISIDLVLFDSFVKVLSTLI